MKFDFVIIVLARVITALLAIASVRVMTTFLTPSDYGQWSLLVAYQTLGALFLINPVDQHVFRFAHIWWDAGKLIENLKKYNLYIIAVSLFIGLIVFLWWSINNGIATAGILSGISVALILYLSSCSIGLSFLLNMLGFRADSVTWAVVSAIVGLLSSTLLVMQYPNAMTWLYGQAIGFAIGALGALNSLRKRHPKLDIPSQKIAFSNFINRFTVFNFCLPLAAATGFMWLQNTGYRLFVGDVWGFTALGFMVIGLGISAQLTAIIESLAMQFLYPYFARRVASAKSDGQIGTALSDLMNVLAPIYAIWAGFNAICATALLELLTDARYHVAVPFVIFGAMIEFMRCTTNLWSNTARAKLKTKGLIMPYMVGAGVICFGMLTAKYFQINLITLSSILVIAGLFTLITMIFIMQKLLLISIDFPRILIALLIMGTCFFVAIFTPLKTNGIFQHLTLLVVSGFVASLLIGLMLWRNAALSRLLSTQLRAV